MKFSLLATLLLPRAVSAVFADDAGILDFTVGTAGHSVTRFVESFEGSILTTDAPSEKTSCYVASRSIDDGTLLWRRNVCASPSDDQSHDIASIADYFYTVDNTGSVRAWTKGGGNLVWDVKVLPSAQPKVWTFSKQGMDFCVVPSGEELRIFYADSGKVFDTISVTKSIGQPKGGESFEWLTGLPDPTNGGVVSLVVGFVKDGMTTGNRMTMLLLEIGNDEVINSKSMGHIKSSIVASSVQVQKVGESWHGLALSADSTPIHFSAESSQFSKNLSVTSVAAIRSTPLPSVISLEGENGETSLYRFDQSAGGWYIHGAEDVQFTALAQCEEANVDIATSNDSLRAYRQGEAMTMTGDLFVPDGDVVEQFSVIDCSSSGFKALLSTASGTTTELSFSVSKDSMDLKIGWSVEEGLASVASAVILDASHLGVDDLVEEQDAVMQKLSFSARLKSQISGLVSSFSSAAGSIGRRDHTFGFVKVAALLSQKSRRVWGMNTSGDDRGAVLWSLDLPKQAKWHTLVHGTANSANAMHGINGGTHSREILVLSASESSVEWKCIDGTSGAVHAQDTMPVSSDVIQVLPIYGGVGGCRQASLLLHQDQTLTVIPGDKETSVLVEEQLGKTPNGLFTHFVDKEASKVVSFQVSGDASGFFSRQVGQTSFAGEKVVKVAYPIRDETVQSMSTVLGDDSLLLKYINPHMAVVITTANNELNQAPTKISQSIDKQKNSKSNRKPSGAGDSVNQAKTVPNMFVNVIDTVSGRVLHRASHVNVDASRDVTALISENWIVYTFINTMTRRTELGVLTLHEGMIDRKGLTIFSSPDQTTTFSSFDARESKPLVLAKLYVYPKAVTALGATTTRGGISSRKILIASDDGRITAIDRKMLETRRPMGEVKDAEKKEGLFPYTELIPEVPLLALSYNKTIESATSIISSETSLESQSLILAFGGADLFFTRTSPTKGFDLLPDSFSRVLVSIVSIGLVVILFVVKRMGSKKGLKQSWL
jgi:hypothetical protein